MRTGTRLAGVIAVVLLVATVFGPRAEAGSVPHGNLLKNGDAEANSGTDGGTRQRPKGWDDVSHSVAAISYEQGGPNGYPTEYQGILTGGGKTFFSGSHLADPGLTTTEIEQKIQLPKDSWHQIDKGNVPITVSGLFGGKTTEGDNATITVYQFTKSGNATGATITVGGVTAADRNNETKLLYRRLSGTLGVGTRVLDVQLKFQRTTGTSNEGFADNLRVELAYGPTVKTGITLSPGASFVGSVGGGPPECIDTETVQVWKKGATRDRLVDSDATDSNGDYSIPFPVPLEAGKYYAKALAIKFNDVNCLASKSATIELG